MSLLEDCIALNDEKLLLLFFFFWKCKQNVIETNNYPHLIALR